MRFAELVGKILTDALPEFDVLPAALLSTALARLARERIGSILTDLDLLDSHGPATVRSLVRAAPSLPLIVLSGHPQTVQQLLAQAREDLRPVQA